MFWYTGPKLQSDLILPANFSCTNSYFPYELSSSSHFIIHVDLLFWLQLQEMNSRENHLFRAMGSK